MFRHCRNINYFGELLIYLGFSLLAMHWVPIACLAAMMILVWFPNMRRKDRSLARYPEFEKLPKTELPFYPLPLLIVCRLVTWIFNFPQTIPAQKQQ